MTPARIQAKDRRRAAIHEAAHIVVARHYGAAVGGYIYPNDSMDEITQRTWLGRMCVYAPSLLAEGRFDCGVAGSLSECRFQDTDCFDDPDTVHQTMIESMSETDRNMAGIEHWPETKDDPNYWKVHERLVTTFQLVCQLWPEIWAESRNLIEQAKEIGAQHHGLHP